MGSIFHWPMFGEMALMTAIVIRVVLAIPVMMAVIVIGRYGVRTIVWAGRKLLGITE